MNEELRKKVLKRLDKMCQTPARFSISLYSDYYGWGNHDRSERIVRLKQLRKDAANLSPKKLILEIIELAEYFGTKSCKTNRLQCKADKRRTASDIWRIILNYRNDIDIFTVMSTLYSLTINHNYDLCTSYCSVVRRRTFRIEDDEIYDENHKDEFGLIFDEWKDI